MLIVHDDAGPSIVFLEHKKAWTNQPPKLVMFTDEQAPQKKQESPLGRSLVPVTEGGELYLSLRVPLRLLFISCKKRCQDLGGGGEARKRVEK